MSKNEMITMIETMNNYDDLAAKAKAKADAIREAIKEEMIRQDTEELVAGAYIVRFTSVISNRFDSTTFKRLYAALRNGGGGESSYNLTNTNTKIPSFRDFGADAANKRT